MALDSIKEKLKKPFHRSKHNRDSSGPDSPTSNAPTRSSVASDRPANDHPSYDQSNARGIAASSRQPVAAAAPESDDNSSRRSSIDSPNDSSLNRTAAPGLHHTEYKLPQVPREHDFSSDFTGLTFGTQQSGHHDRHGANGRIATGLDEGRNSVNIADRNITSSAQNPPSMRMVDEEPRSKPLIPNVDHHANNVADWNIVRNDDPAAGSRNDAPQPLDVKKQRGAEAVTADSLDQDNPQTRDMSWSVTPLAMVGMNDKSPLDAQGKKSNLNREVPGNSDNLLAPRRSSLDKPLPLTPPAAMSLDRSLKANGRAFGDVPGDNDDFVTHMKEQTTGPFDLEGVAVKQEPDTVSLHEHHAPAVTHETIVEDRREVRQQVITRETHDYHIYHRILPIIDIEVMPARHFVPIQDGFVEIAEEELPGRTREKVNWAIAEMVSKRMPETRQAAVARHFTARKFEGTEHDDREYIGPEGHPVKEKWWVHPPTLCEDAYRKGQTYPFHFGAANPADNGLKAKLPAGNIVGVSRRLLEKRKKEAEALAAAEQGGVDEPVLSTSFI